MFGKPRHGWTSIHIADFDAPASYLTDIPFDVLASIEAYYKLFTPLSIMFNGEEFGEYYIVSNYFSTYIITNEEEHGKLYDLEINTNQLIDEMMEDIEKHFPEWSEWIVIADTVEEFESEVKEREQSLYKRLDEVKKIIHDARLENKHR